MPKKTKTDWRMVRFPVWVLRELEQWGKGLTKAYDDGSITEGPDERHGWVYWRMVLMLLRRDTAHRKRSRRSVSRSTLRKGESRGSEGKD